MVEQKDDHLSPEEKLLRVIQGGGQKRKAAAVAPVAAAPKPEVETRAAEPAEKSRLKVARGAAAGAAAVAEPVMAEPVIAEPVNKVAAPSTEPPPAEKGADLAKRVSTESELSVRTLNIVLAMCILVVLFFNGHEILANIRFDDTAVSVESVPLPEDEIRDEEREFQQLDKLLDAIDQRQFFAVATPVDVVPPRPPGRKPDEYLRLMGVSLDGKSGKHEAIVMDNDLKKMQYLKVGDAITSSGQSWTLKDIQADTLIFSNGADESVVR